MNHHAKVDIFFHPTNGRVENSQILLITIIMSPRRGWATARVRPYILIPDWATARVRPYILIPDWATARVRPYILIPDS